MLPLTLSVCEENIRPLMSCFFLTYLVFKIRKEKRFNERQRKANVVVGGKDSNVWKNIIHLSAFARWFFFLCKLNDVSTVVDFSCKQFKSTLGDRRLWRRLLVLFLFNSIQMFENLSSQITEFKENFAVSSPGRWAMSSAEEIFSRENWKFKTKIITLFTFHEALLTRR